MKYQKNTILTMITQKEDQNLIYIKDEELKLNKIPFNII